jgi:hypothetical protein
LRGLSGRIILKCIVGKEGVRMWSEFMYRIQRRTLVKTVMNIRIP